MGSLAHSLEELLTSGKVKPSRLLRGGRDEGGSPGWEFGRLTGRVVELTGTRATARLSVAARLVLEAQRLREPTAWLSRPEATFYPPDVAKLGVDLETLAVVRAPDAHALLGAADELLRSGAFGLVVLDLSHERVDIRMHAQVRLLNLTKAHDALLLLLLDDARGSLASVRARVERQREGDRFACSIHVHKDKRNGRGWTHREVFDGPLGLC